MSLLILGQKSCILGPTIFKNSTTKLTLEFIPVAAVVFSIDLVGDKGFSSILSWVARTVRKKRLHHAKSKKEKNNYFEI